MSAPGTAVHGGHAPAASGQREDAGTDARADASASSWFLLAVTGATAIAGFLYGYDTGIISGALLEITEQFKLARRAQERVTSAILLGAAIGAFASGWAVDKIGRRWTIRLLASVYTVGAIASSLAPGRGVRLHPPPRPRNGRPEP